MLIELGHFALTLAFVVALMQGVLPLWGIQRKDSDLIALARPAARVQFALLIFSFAALAYGFLTDNFSLRYVAQHSNTLLPAYYKFSAVWSAHEGSLLLWALMLALWTFAVSELSRSLPEVFVARVLATMGFIAAGFLLFTLATSNPFERVFPPPLEGRDLNPLLQDPGLIIHPPMLYMGYVGFSVAFAFAIAALLGGELNQQWARWSRPWTLIAWVFLTLGIGLGSWWAYHELGWGGWWFWDPVENASFMPWLVGTALIHSLAVTEKRDTFKSWTVFLAILAFSLSLLGTFLVRSGVLVSVHAFATDPARGVFILAFLVVVVGSALLLYTIRAPSIKSTGSFEPVSRESALLINNVILVATMFTILTATLYPLVLDAFGTDKISVGAPYFTAVFVPLMLPLLLLAGFGPHTKWQKDTLKALSEYWPLIALALVLAGSLLVWIGQYSVGVFFGVSAALWIIFSVAAFLYRSYAPRPGQEAQGEQEGQEGQVVQAGQGKRKLALSYWGMSVAHFGLAVFVLGVTFNGAYSSEKVAQTEISKHVDLAGYRFYLRGVSDRAGPNYDSQMGHVEVFKEQKRVATLYPEKRVYTVQKSPMTEASIHSTPLHDLYVSLGDQTEDGRWTIRAYYRPFMQWIWFGALLIAAGGLISAFDRRYQERAS